jgi:CheY-like chemotaxis protein
VNQELATELLESHGLIVEVAENGQQALDKLEQSNFDGILMDCNMPVMDGYTATKRIREQPQYAHLPIIAMTANAMQSDREHALSVGMNDHIPKPIDVAEMLTVMAKWISSRHTMGGTDAPLAREKDDTILLPEKIPGIDIASGVARAQGNKALYLRLLNGARRSFEELAPALQTARLSVRRCSHNGHRWYRTMTQR